MMDDLALINEIGKWLFIVCSLILVYFGVLVFTKVRKERQWRQTYLPSLDTLTEYDVRTHETLKAHQEHEKEKAVQEALERLVEAARQATESEDGDTIDDEFETASPSSAVRQSEQTSDQVSDHEYHPKIETGYYHEYEPDEKTQEHPSQQMVRFVDKNDK
jgi:hypothetical protein